MILGNVSPRLPSRMAITAILSVSVCRCGESVMVSDRSSRSLGCRHYEERLGELIFWYEA